MSKKNCKNGIQVVAKTSKLSDLSKEQRRQAIWACKAAGDLNKPENVAALTAVTSEKLR